MAELQLRFRHVSGDLGPFTFPDSMLVQQVKEKLLAEWPKDGAMAKEPPLQAGDIKLIMSGKYLDGTKVLKEYRKDMGEIQADTIVTLHLVIRPTAAAKKPAASGAAPADQEQSKGCGCVIC